MYTGVHLKCPAFCSNVNCTWIFPTDFCNIVEFKVHKNPSSGNQVVLCRRKDRRANGQTDTHYKFNIRLSKFYERCYKQRRNWVARVKTEKLGSEGCTVVTRTQVPDNLSSLATCCVHLHIQLFPTFFLDCLIFEQVSLSWTETSLTNYQLPLCGFSVQWSRKLHFGVSLKSRSRETLC
jgi:hypothetical protein